MTEYERARQLVSRHGLSSHGVVRGLLDRLKRGEVTSQELTAAVALHANDAQALPQAARLAGVRREACPQSGDVAKRLLARVFR